MSKRTQSNVTQYLVATYVDGRIAVSLSEVEGWQRRFAHQPCRLQLSPTEPFIAARFHMTEILHTSNPFYLHYNRRLIVLTLCRRIGDRDLGSPVCR